ncbi:MAG TPA: carboxypeptidase-like regulatory domain-containing protein, partial [Candidatus Marinimicrobia bacterium]|nr:carboxypeptidase-like regulatory domain-containing protein [Candidatus Neomarinimicrobiota bacterium]
MKLRIVLALFLLSSLSWTQSGRINGFITDEETGEVLMGANVFFLETGEGMATDMNGYYVLDGIPPGEYTFLVSYLGYEEYRENFTFEEGEVLTHNVALIPVVLEIEEVVVEGEKIQRKVNIQPGKVNLNPRQIKSYPALAEPDIFRAIQALPGVLTSSEFSTGLIIRGGNT